LLCSGVTGITLTPSGSTSVPHHQLDRNRKKTWSIQIPNVLYFPAGELQVHDIVSLTFFLSSLCAFRVWCNLHKIPSSCSPKKNPSSCTWPNLL
jgi:hypothetical protein